MFERSYREKSITAERQRGGAWRRVRKLLVLAIVAATVCGNMLVTVKAAAGDLDTTFSTDGKVRTVFGLNNEIAYGVAIQSDGKIVVAGETNRNSTGKDFALARYNIDGTLDATFSDDGKQTTDFSGTGDSARAVAIQSDGKIIAAGYTGASGTSYFALARYNIDGTLDTTFSDDGKQTTDFGIEALALSMAIQPNGKIVLGGFTGGSTDDFALARYNIDGTLDTTFSGDGKQTTNFGSAAAATAIAIQPNAKIVAAGVTVINGEGRFALARYNRDGTLDTNFSGDGKQTTQIGDYAEARAVAIQPDSKIVVAGYAIFPGTNYDFALARYNGNGHLDDGSVNDRTPADMFGTDGIVTTDFFGSRDEGNAVAIQPDGKIVVAGLGRTGSEFFTSDFALARYNIDGMLDNTFSGDGKQITGFASGSFDAANAVALQSDGKIVAAGFVGKRNSDFDFGVARYLGD